MNTDKNTILITFQFSSSSVASSISSISRLTKGVGRFLFTKQYSEKIARKIRTATQIAIAMTYSGCSLSEKMAEVAFGDG